MIYYWKNINFFDKSFIQIYNDGTAVIKNIYIWFTNNRWKWSLLAFQVFQDKG